MTRRQPLIAGNWKMHKTIAQAESYLDVLLESPVDTDAVSVAVGAPFTALSAVSRKARGSGVSVLAQNMHEAPEGAFTGEVSPPMLRELGVDGVILGHSERREHFGETDRALAAKVAAALDAGLMPVLCVGETEQEREREETQRKLRHQVREGLEQVPVQRLPEVVIAYEPIWAIGTGLVATAEQAQEAVAFVRALVGDRSPQAGASIRVLYGGSVNPGNARELLGLPDVDGALVGGASLDPTSFLAIVEAARP